MANLNIDILAIVQARVGSTRLENKILKTTESKVGFHRLK